MQAIAFYNQDFFLIKEDTEAIKENITRILLTQPGERINNPFFGSKLKEFLFEIETVLSQDLEREIKNAISRWEPRVTVNSIISEKLEDGRYLISLVCTMLETLEVFTYERLINL